MDGPTPYTPPDGHILVPAGSPQTSPVVPDGWEIAILLYELRPVVKLPDPEFMCNGTWADRDGRMCGVTTIGEMRDRSDLDQWEYANPYWGEWDSFAADGTRFDAESEGFPLVVRRKGGG